MKAANLLRATALGILLATPPRTAAGADRSRCPAGSLQLLRLARGEPDQQARGPTRRVGQLPGGQRLDHRRWLGQHRPREVRRSGRRHQRERRAVGVQFRGVQSLRRGELRGRARPRSRAASSGTSIPTISTDDSERGLQQRVNTWEVYGTVGFDVPLAPELSLYYDFDKIKGAYFEGAVSHSVPLGETHTLDLGGVVGLSVGQGHRATTNRSTSPTTA